MKSSGHEFLISCIGNWCTQAKGHVIYHLSVRILVIACACSAVACA